MTVELSKSQLDLSTHSFKHLNCLSINLSKHLVKGYVGYKNYQRLVRTAAVPPHSYPEAPARTLDGGAEPNPFYMVLAGVGFWWWWCCVWVAAACWLLAGGGENM